MENEEFSFENNAISQSKIYSFGWGMWHNPTSSKSGTSKNKDEALKGYKKSRNLLVGSLFPENQSHNKIYGVEYGNLLGYINERIVDLESGQ